MYKSCFKGSGKYCISNWKEFYSMLNLTKELQMKVKWNIYFKWNGNEKVDNL